MDLADLREGAAHPPTQILAPTPSPPPPRPPLAVEALLSSSPAPTGPMAFGIPENDLLIFPLENFENFLHQQTVNVVEGSSQWQQLGQRLNELRERHARNTHLVLSDCFAKGKKQLNNLRARCEDAKLSKVAIKFLMDERERFLDARRKATARGRLREDAAVIVVKWDRALAQGDEAAEEQLRRGLHGLGKHIHDNIRLCLGQRGLVPASFFMPRFTCKRAADGRVMKLGSCASVTLPLLPSPTNALITLLATLPSCEHAHATPVSMEVSVTLSCCLGPHPLRVLVRHCAGTSSGLVVMARTGSPQSAWDELPQSCWAALDSAVLITVAQPMAVLVLAPRQRPSVDALAPLTVRSVMALEYLPVDKVLRFSWRLDFVGEGAEKLDDPLHRGLQQSRPRMLAQHTVLCTQLDSSAQVQYGEQLQMLRFDVSSPASVVEFPWRADTAPMVTVLLTGADDRREFTRPFVLQPTLAVHQPAGLLESNEQLLLQERGIHLTEDCVLASSDGRICSVGHYYGKPCIVKSVLPSTSVKADDLLKLSHENIAALYVWLPQRGVKGQGPERPLLVREMASTTLAATSLAGASYALHHGIITNIVDGVSYLHSVGLAHGRLHPRNVLLCATLGDAPFTAKVCDGCGLRTDLDLQWRAPELTRESAPTAAADCFGVGIMVMHVLGAASVDACDGAMLGAADLVRSLTLAVPAQRRTAAQTGPWLAQHSPAAMLAALCSLAAAAQAGAFSPKRSADGAEDARDRVLQLRVRMGVELPVEPAAIAFGDCADDAAITSTMELLHVIAAARMQAQERIGAYGDKAVMTGLQRAIGLPTLCKIYNFAKLVLQTETLDI